MDLVSRAFLGVHLVCAVTASREMFLQVLGGDESLATLAALVARLQQVNLWLHMSVQVWLCHPFVVAQSAAILANTWSGYIANAQSSGKQELIKEVPIIFCSQPFLICKWIKVVDTRLNHHTQHHPRLNIITHSLNYFTGTLSKLMPTNGSLFINTTWEMTWHEIIWLWYPCWNTPWQNIAGL